MSAIKDKVMALTKQRIYEIEDTVEEILSQALDKDVFPPIDLVKVLEHLDLKVELGDFGKEEVLGGFSRTEKTIYLQTDVSFSRQLFTIAHEIGHFVLHKEKEKDIFFRNTESFDNAEIKREEQEANWFAASLLMPRKIFLEFYKLDPSIPNIAERFLVSKSAAYYRLQNIDC